MAPGTALGVGAVSQAQKGTALPNAASRAPKAGRCVPDVICLVECSSTSTPSVCHEPHQTGARYSGAEHKQTHSEHMGVRSRVQLDAFPRRLVCTAVTHRQTEV